jgi:hypothetical protein
VLYFKNAIGGALWHFAAHVAGKYLRVQLFARRAVILRLP